jgi:hypothetical protein
MVAIWRSSSRSPPLTIEIAPSGTPLWRAANETTCASTAFECAAVDEPRSTIALPDLRQSAEQSTVTFGRASYTTATTPSGTRTRRTSSPFSSRWPSIVSPTGSGSATIARTSLAMPARRASSSLSRSSRPACRPASSPASMSRALASRISSLRCSSASAIASRAAFLVAVLRVASSSAARRAWAQISATDWAVVAIAARVPGAAPRALALWQWSGRRLSRYRRCHVHAPEGEREHGHEQRRDRHQRPRVREA